MVIKKALITTAGFGTRFLPISKTIQKEMLPILGRPLVDYVVRDCVKAGIKEIVLAINKHNRQVIHYYSENKRLTRYLKRTGKREALRQIADIHAQAKFTFVEQSSDDPYGTAVPVMMAEEHLKDEEAFLVFMGDDFIYSGNGSAEATAMMKLFERSGAEALGTFIKRPDNVLHKYGIAEVEKTNGFTYLKKIVEKPAPGKAPSNLANISKYIFTPRVFELIKKQPVDKKSGELYITDTLQNIARRSKVVVHAPRGEYLDGGYVLGWLKANLRVAKDDPELKRALTKYLRAEFL
jgi:UTP--glucose-1-phosphate uridylyltransferase